MQNIQATGGQKIRKRRSFVRKDGLFCLSSVECKSFHQSTRWRESNRIWKYGSGVQKYGCAENIDIIIILQVILQVAWPFNSR